MRHVFKNNRSLSLTLIVLMTLLAWVYLVMMTKDMQGRMDMSEMGLGMGIFNLLDSTVLPTSTNESAHHSEIHTKPPAGSFGMPSPGLEWVATDFTLVYVMWFMMMVAMMLPTAMPMIMTYADILGNRPESESALFPLCMFISGYLIAWGGYAVVASLIQWRMLQAGLMSEMMVGINPVLNGGLLILAGCYQLSRLKDACLTHCRTPLQFFLSSWKSGNAGALQMGIKHGAYCVGCCWALMVLMFFFGAMNLIWIAGLSVIMLAEKILPRGDLFGKGIGIGFFVWGVILIATRLYAQ